MPYLITKDFAFSYSHRLSGLAEGHPCARMHGHNAVVRVSLASDRLDETGFVLDYGALAPLGAWLDATFDHRHLNDVVDFNPTAEQLAAFVGEWIEDHHPDWPLAGVSWSETPKTWATWTP